MTEPSKIAAYDKWHHKMGEGGRSSPLTYPWYASVYRALQSETRGDVLEVGCGRGEFAIWLSSQKPELRVMGLDFSHAAIRLATDSAANEGSSARFVQGDAEALPFPDASFDIVVSCECMEHVPHPRKMAAEIARVARPGARFFLTTENYLNGMLVAWLRTWMTGKPFNSGSGVQPRENFFFFWMVKGYLQVAGLSVERTESCHYQWLLLPRVDPAKLCTTYFLSPWARWLAHPFGRHFSFFGRRN